MNYETINSLTKGQVIFQSNDQKGVRPIVLIQMPEVRALQIIKALNLVTDIAEMGKAGVTNHLEEVLKEARDIINLPIEKS